MNKWNINTVYNFSGKKLSGRLSSSFRRVLKITEQKRLLAAGEVRGRGQKILADG